MSRTRALVVAAGIMLTGCAHAAAPAATTPGTTDPQAFSQVERGRYLTVLGDCAACHTEPGGAAFAGGRAIETPFGNILAPNITPDRQTGIGAWTDGDFVRAMTDGRGRHGLRLYPAMPYAYYTKMSRNEVLAIRAYLNTVAPVQHAVHSDILPFPFNIRLSMAVWNWLYFKPGAFQPNPQKSAEWNRGAYIVEGPAHCGACHTPKTILGGDRTRNALHGDTLQGWFAPDIASDKRIGLGDWSVEDIVEYLKTGVNQHTAASGPMAEEVMDSSSQMTLEDLRAVAVYLKDQPAAAVEAPKPVAADDPVMKAGQAIYADACAACHTMDGTGIQRLFPTLKGTPFVQSVQPMSLIRVVLQGTRAAATRQAPTGPAMPSFGWKLSDEQAASVLTYIRNAWGNAAPAVTAGDVKSARAELAGRSD